MNISLGKSKNRKVCQPDYEMAVPFAGKINKMRIKEEAGRLEIIADCDEERNVLNKLLTPGTHYETKLNKDGLVININPELMDVTQLATRLQFHPDSIRRKCRRGEIPHRKLDGYRLFFVPQEIEQWINNNKIDAGESDKKAADILDSIRGSIEGVVA